MDKQGYSINTFGKRIKVLKTIMRASKDRGLHSNTDYEKRDFKVLSKSYKRPYLKLEEINLIYKCELSEKHDKYRNMFVLLCTLGIRISDLPQINKGNIAKIQDTNYLSIKMRKTNKQVTIPIPPIAMQIIEKYNYKLPNVNEQILNKEIKNICKIAGLDREFKNERGKFKLHDIVTSHDGRRSFATNCYLNGLSASQIMEITGHKTESSFLRYIQETKTPQALEIFKVFEAIELK
jgi:integrase